MTIYRVEDLPARLADKIQIDGNGCWIWTGFIGEAGYGQSRHDVAFAQRYVNGRRRGGRTAAVHRVVYELLVGPIPDGLQIDHRCRVKLCCNPAHLEAVTRSVNNLRAHHGQNYIPATTGTQLSFDDLLSQHQQMELL